MTAKADTNPLREALPKPETMLTYASMLEKPQYHVDAVTGAKFRLATGEVVEAACAALRYCAALASEPVAGTAELASHGTDRKRVWMLHFEDADRGFAIYDNEPEAHEAYEKASVSWNCTLLETSARKYDFKCGQLNALSAPPAPAAEDIGREAEELIANSRPAPAGREEIARAIATQLGENYDRLVDLHLNAGFCQDDFLRAADAALALGATVSPQDGGGELLNVHPFASAEWRKDYQPNVRSVSQSPDDGRCVMVWFKRPATGQDREWLTAALTATPPAPGAADRTAVIEECAKFVEQHQETNRETSNGSERYLAPRKVGNLMGIAYVDGLRALAVPRAERGAGS